MRTLDLSVVAYDGPMARVYLRVLEEAGLRPKHVTLLLLEKWAPPRWLRAWMPERLARQWTKKRQASAMNFWPRRLLLSSEYDSVLEALSNLHPAAESILRKVFVSFDFSKCAESYDELVVSGYQDPRLAEAAARLPTGHLLFTGGGIVPPALLRLPGKRFLHVHPGHLPDVRGADGMLWSALVRKRIAASVFYLAEGIDTGDILYRREIELPPIRLPDPRPSDAQLYRALFSFYDPLLRAVTLATFLEASPDLSAAPAFAQSPRDGLTYHFMHPRLQTIALRKLFGS